MAKLTIADLEKGQAKVSKSIEAAEQQILEKQKRISELTDALRADLTSADTAAFREHTAERNSLGDDVNVLYAFIRDAKANPCGYNFEQCLEAYKNDATPFLQAAHIADDDIRGAAEKAMLAYISKVKSAVKTRTMRAKIAKLAPAAELDKSRLEEVELWHARDELNLWRYISDREDLMDMYRKAEHED